MFSFLFPFSRNRRGENGFGEIETIGNVNWALVTVDKYPRGSGNYFVFVRFVRGFALEDCLARMSDSDV